jgi:predicted ATPase
MVQALQLFVSRAGARQQGFALRKQDLKAVCEICRRLDGLPLAIELAATQIDALALIGLQAQLDNCFQLLTQGRRTAAPRHQTLKASLDWSYEPLGLMEQAVLQRLAVFKMAFTLDAAIEAINCEVLKPAQLTSLVQRLVAKSLLSTDHANGTIYYRLLNTTRAYALEKLERSGHQRAFERRYAHYISGAHWVPGS